MSLLYMSNNNNNDNDDEERRPLAKEGEWSAYMDTNYNRIYYFNHETVSCFCLFVFLSVRPLLSFLL